MSVPIARILETKGHEVTTITPDRTVAEAVTLLDRDGIGALVVVEGSNVRGILSERDVVRRLASDGHAALERGVGEVMTAPVTTCTPESTISELMATMTDQRIRHLPVCVDDRLVGIVSIGDVVKWRLDELREERDHLEEYVTGTY